MDGRTAEFNYEYGVIGSLLIDFRCMREVSGILSDKDFATPICADIFRAAENSFRKGQKFDALIAAETIKDKFEDGGKAFILELMDITPTAANVGAYAKALKKESRERNLKLSLQESLSDVSGDELAHNASEICRKYLDGQELKRSLTLTQMLTDYYARRNERSKLRIDTGYDFLDEKLKGFWGGQLIVIAARPGVGKTAFALELIRNAAQNGRKVHFYSLEMDSGEVLERLIANAGDVEMDALIDGMPQDGANQKKVTHAAAKLSGLNVVVNDDPRITVDAIEAEAKRDGGVEMIVVDYLQLMTAKKKIENRNLEVAEISRGLKLLAKELKIPVIALSQLNRRREQTEKPTLADLRDSGSIEQDADKVLFIWNTGESDKDGQKNCVSVEKNRRGERGNILFNFSGKYMRFTEIREMSAQDVSGQKSTSAAKQNYRPF